MRDHLLDLVEHTLDLGCIDLVRIAGTDTETAIDAVAEDRSVVVKAEFAAPVADFIGTFGMPNLSKLKIMLNLQEYRENAVLRLTKNTTGEPDGVEFQNATGDFKNSYRFMSGALVNGKLKTVTFKGVPWHVEFGRFYWCLCWTRNVGIGIDAFSAFCLCGRFCFIADFIQYQIPHQSSRKTTAQKRKRI